jgi:hypothetical protein
MAITYDPDPYADDEDDFEPLPTIVEGFDGVHVRSVYAHAFTRFAISEAGELFSWGLNNGDAFGYRNDEELGTLGHGDWEDQPSLKRVEALRRVPVSCVSIEKEHGLALTESGLVYAWGHINHITPTSDTCCEYTMEPLPKPVEALRDVRVGVIAQGGERSYAVGDTGELWAWDDRDENIFVPLAGGEQVRVPAFKPMESLQGVKVYSVAASDSQTLALADNGRVYAWDDEYGAPGLGLICLADAVGDAGEDVQTPQRISELRVACGL